MTGKPAQRQHRYREGGQRKQDEPAEPLMEPARNKSWRRGDKGQGAEGLSKGYGGSSGDGTEASGPDRNHTREKPPQVPRRR